MAKKWIHDSETLEIIADDGVTLYQDFDNAKRKRAERFNRKDNKRECPDCGARPGEEHGC